MSLDRSDYAIGLNWVATCHKSDKCSRGQFRPGESFGEWMSPLSCSAQIWIKRGSRKWGEKNESWLFTTFWNWFQFNWKPTRSPWCEGRGEWFPWWGGSWLPTRGPIAYLDLATKKQHDLNIYKLTSCSSVLTSAPMTPREVSRRYSNGLESSWHAHCSQTEMVGDQLEHQRDERIKFETILYLVLDTVWRKG